MSTGRFKSRDDYFGRKSGLAERVLHARPPKIRRRAAEQSIPAALLRVHFCKTVETFEIEGRGRFHMGEFPLDDAITSHLDGEVTLLVNPLSHTGETAFTVMKFDLSESMDHPFTRARQFADELQKHGVPCLVEVTEGGKGHYHLWLFHEEPIPAAPFAEALVRLGKSMFGAALETVPSPGGDVYIPLPLQGESMLLQRRVFVNAVGKMIRDQGGVVASIAFCPKKVSGAFIERMAAGEVKAPPSATQAVRVPEPPKPEVPIRPAPMGLSPRPEPKPVIAAAPVHSQAAAKPSETAPAAAPRPIPAMEPAGRPIAEPVEAGHPVPASEPAKPPVAPVIIETAPRTAAPAVKPVEPPASPAGGERRPERLLCFLRGDVEFGVPVEIAGRVISLGSEHRVASVRGIHGTMRFDGGAAVLLDPLDVGGVGGRRAGPPKYAVLLRGRDEGYALLADRVRGVRDLPGERIVRSASVDIGRYAGRPSGTPVMVPDVAGIRRLNKEEQASPGIRAITGIAGGSFVVVSVDGKVYGIPAETVLKVIPFDGEGESEIPETGPAPVSDAASRKPAAVTGDHHHRRGIALLVSRGGARERMRVDRVIGVRRITADRIELVPGPFGGVHAAARFEGDDRFIAILADPTIG